MGHFILEYNIRDSNIKVGFKLHLIFKLLKPNLSSHAILTNYI